jgi:hypothetical protein
LCLRASASKRALTRVPAVSRKQRIRSSSRIDLGNPGGPAGNSTSALTADPVKFATASCTRSGKETYRNDPRCTPRAVNVASFTAVHTASPAARCGR